MSKLSKSDDGIRPPFDNLGPISSDKINSRPKKKDQVQKPMGYWTLNRCQAEARKYKTRNEWRTMQPSSYTISTQNGWLAVCCSHMTRVQEPTGYWNLERCQNEAKKYPTKKAWRAKHKSSHSAATKKGWLKECCSHMLQLRKPQGYWTLEQCKKEANRYNTRGDWEKGNHASYHKAAKMGWINQCSTHMTRQGNRYNRQLYVFEHPDKTVYVGLAYNPNNRYKQHMRKSKLLIEGKKKGGQRFKILDEFYLAEIAAVKEEELIQHYKMAGWTMLNKMPGGALGGSIVKWDLEACKNEAKKFTTRGEWSARNHASYSVACKNNWLELCCSHMTQIRKLPGYWTLEQCLDEANKYETKEEWRRKDPASHGAAYTKGWLEQCCANMIQVRKSRGYWNLERCQEEARKCKIKREWAEKYPSSFDAAVRNEWLDECCTHMIQVQKPKGYWTLERCQEVAKNYKSRKEWRIKHPSSYSTSCQNGWIDKCCGHMIQINKPHGYWTLKRCEETAKTFSTRSEWQTNHISSYDAAFRNRWLDQCCAHMIQIRKPRGYWTLQRCGEEARIFSTRGEWKINHATSYDAATRNRWLDQCCSHMSQVNRPKNKLLSPTKNQVEQSA